MSAVWVSTPFNIDLEFEIAPFYKRLLAWVSDLAVLLVYATGMKSFVLDNLVFDGQKYPLGIDLLLVSVPMLLYPFFMEVSLQGQTLGKRLMKIRVISLEGGEPNMGQYVMRWIFRFWEWPLVFGYVAIAEWTVIGQVISSVLFGLFVAIVVAVSPKNQRLGDMAAGTTVVSVSHAFTLSDTVFQNVATPNYKVSHPEVMRLSDRDINAVKGVITQYQRTGQYETAHRVANKIKTVLSIQSDKDVNVFLETLLADYNYLATKDD
ncbi:MAG: RDD family protein [Bacteroidetes bacterium]|nr:MAG: RDD family protein [Bacteroidota bacterium]